MDQRLGFDFGRIRIHVATPVQAKLTVSQAHDPDEREADRVADAALHAPAGTTGRVTPVTTGGLAVPPADVSRIERLRGGGAPLPEQMRERLEPYFGHDLGDVRVHRSAPATEVAASLGARAFTSGRDIGFAPGQFSPGTEDGDRLLAHEVTHVVQQAGTGSHVARWPMPWPVAVPVTPLTFSVRNPDLTPKKWSDRDNVHSGAADTRTDVDIDGPASSTIDVTLDRQVGMGHTHTNVPTNAMHQRFMQGHLTNKAGGKGAQETDFQINSSGKARVITYHAPHAAGQIKLTAQVRGSTDPSHTVTADVTAAVAGLTSYTPSFANETLVGQVADHDTNHWGVAAAHAEMTRIVRDFRNAWVAVDPATRNANDAPTIKVNDFSLEHGGCYDFKGNWFEPHKTHREGRNIDVARTVLINGANVWLKPGSTTLVGVAPNQDTVGDLYDMLNGVVGVPPEDTAHWHVTV